MKINKKKEFLKRNKLFLGSIIFMISIVLFAIINLDKFKMITNQLFRVCTTYFGWLYLIAMLLFVIASVCIAFSRYGNIKLGKKEDKPEYSNKSWFAMLFCAGMGVGLVFWGVSEPISHYINPLGCEGGTIDASKFAFRTVFMHWGIHPWACYAIVGLAVAYFKFKREKSGLISSTISDVITNRIVLKIVDFLAVFATIAGIVTSLGLGVLQVNSGLNYLMNVPYNVSMQIVIIVLVTIIFIISAVSGINKGVKLLSNVNLILAIFLTVFCFLIGPKLDILNNLTSGLGGYLSNIIQDSLAIETYGDNSWLSSWRIFYWAWWVAWAPFVGIFIARISKGRTIREFILGVVLAPTLASIIWFSVWGTLGISLGQNGRLTTESLTNIAASPETGLFVVLSEYLQGGGIVPGLMLALIIIFFVTSADSGTYVLAMLTSEGNINPAKNKKIVWGIIQAILAVLLLVCGGLKPLQTISIVAALPFLCVMIVQIIALFKDLRDEKEKNENNHIEYIVFGSEHYNPLGIIRSLGEAGISPVAVIVRSNRPFASKSKYIKKLHLVDSIVEGYTLIQNTYNSHNPDCKSIILTGGDDATSILDIHFDELKDGFIFQNAGKKGRITHYMDKKAINELAKEKGFDVLENVVLYKDDNIPDLEYPVITKSISSNAGGKKDVFICHDKVELTEAFSKIKSDPVLVQKYIYKKNELCLDGFSINKGRDVVITMATDYKYILEDSYSQYMNMYSYDDHKVIRILTDMLTEIGYEGIFTIEFLVDKNDNLHFLEINLRNSGWSYACTCVGMNMPVLWSDAMIKERIASDAIKHIPEGSTAMADLDDFRVRVRGKKMNIFKWYQDFKKCTSVFYYNKMDKKPLFLLLLSRVIRIR